MRDIVERLRDWEEYDEGKIGDARAEAADEITRLRAEVEKLKAALRQIAGIDTWDDNEQGYVDKARAALGDTHE